MPNHATREIRNVAVVGHGGSGKTTIVESLLVAAGAIGAAGSVEKGTAVCDYEPEERAHQQSLWNAVASLDHDSAHVTFVDSPGYPDFLGRALPALAAVETAAVVVDARSGIQTTTRRMMETAAARGLARLVVVNKIDAPDLDLAALVASLQEVFGSECLPINLPAPGREQVVDCFFDPDPSAATEFSSVEEAQSRVVDQAVEMDEELMEKFLEEGEVSPDELRGASGARSGKGTSSRCARLGGYGGRHRSAARRARPGSCRARPKRARGRSPPRTEVRSRSSPIPTRGVGGGLPGDHRPFRRQALRVPHPRRHGDARHPAPRRRRAQALQGGTPLPLQGKDHVEIDEGVPGDICAVAKVDEIGTERCCTPRAATCRVPRRSPCPRRCTGSPSRPRPAATSRSSRTHSRSSRPRTRA